MTRIFTLALAATLLSAAHAAAQTPQAQVEAAVRSFYQHLNDGNAAAWATLQSSSYHGNFPREGAVFGTGLPNPTQMQAGFDSGATSYQLTLHHLNVTVYGDAAVATFYSTGPSVLPSGARIEGTYRISQVWIRQGGAWRIVHFHISPLVA